MQSANSELCDTSLVNTTNKPIAEVEDAPDEEFKLHIREQLKDHSTPQLKKINFIDVSTHGITSITARPKEELKSNELAFKTLNKYALPKSIKSSSSSLASRRNLMDIPKLGFECKCFLFTCFLTAYFISRFIIEKILYQHS